MMMSSGTTLGSRGDALLGFWRDEDATTSLEYALMLAVIAVSAALGYQHLGLTVSDGATDGQSVGSAASSSTAASGATASSPGAAAGAH